MVLNNFIVLEGCDGAGTTTQRHILCGKLAALTLNNGKHPVVFDTAEPTGSPAGRLLREALRGDIPTLPQTRAFLFAADRNEHLYGSGGIIEHSKQGAFIVCDRYTLSSWVYQGIECGDELPSRLNALFPVPELLFYIDIDSGTAIKRIEGRQRKEIYEYLDFQRTARERYLEFLPRCAELGSRVVTIDGSAEESEVARHIWSAVENMPIFRA